MVIWPVDAIEKREYVGWVRKYDSGSNIATKRVPCHVKEQTGRGCDKGIRKINFTGTHPDAMPCHPTLPFGGIRLSALLGHTDSLSATTCRTDETSEKNTN